MGYSHGREWTDEDIQQEILNVMKALGINRMPSKTEMESVTESSSLSCVISKRKGFKYWAYILGLAIKDSETKLGKQYEDVAAKILESRGYKVERTTTRSPYDLLVDGCIRVDVKVGRPYLLRGARVHTIGINKKFTTCDLYLIFALDEKEEIERTFIIPGTDLKLTSLNFGTDSKYNKYLERWDFFQMYKEFYKKLS